MVKILVCDPIHEKGIKLLKDAEFTLEIRNEITPKELQQVIKDYDAVITRTRTKITKKLMDKAKNLKVIARASVGLDNIDINYAKEKGISVINSPEANSNAVAELSLGMILNLTRKISEANTSMKNGKWEKKKYTGIEIQGKTLGIIGLGKIGYTLGKKAKCLGMRVLTFARPRAMQKVDEIGAVAVAPDTLYKESDFISIHVPLVPQTKHMISTNEFNKMKDGVHIINTSRGGVIDESALKKALDSGKVRGAALDVFQNEPFPDKELICRSNVLCTPHIGGASAEAQMGNSMIVAEKLIKFFKN
jgi:D-3-phosphoglycerate dehydrogenase